MMNHNELVSVLRSTESRSKRELLDEAAATIEALLADLCNSDCRQVCDFCAHGQGHVPCEESNIFCFDCPFDCACKDCIGNSKWEWRGVVPGEGG